MAITYNGNNISNVTFNGNNLNKVTYNGNTVWQKITSTYVKLVSSDDNITVYLRGTPSEGYTAYNVESGDAYITGSEDNNKKVVQVIVENDCTLPSNCRCMFRLCNQLASLDLSKFNTSKVSNMSFMFDNCRQLTELNLSNFNTSSVTNMAGMFPGCTGLESLNLSNFNTSNVTDMSGMFDGSNKLTEIDLTGFDTSNVTNMAGMFAECILLEHIYAGIGWNTNAVANSNYMFVSDTNLHNYNSSYIDKRKAIIDDGSNGGYLERKT